MEKDFEKLVKTINKFQGISLIDTSTDQSWIHFKLDNDSTLAVLSVQITDIKENYPCNLLVLANQHDPKDYSYQIFDCFKNLFYTWVTFVSRFVF